MNCSINSYKSIVFDCDGVILNSNSIKTQAFYDTTAFLGLMSQMSSKTII